MTNNQCSPQDFDKARDRGIVDKGSLRDGPVALIRATGWRGLGEQKSIFVTMPEHMHHFVTFVAECSMIMPLPS